MIVVHCFRNDGSKGRGGGVLLAIKPYLQLNTLPHLENNAEIVWCEIRDQNTKILLGSYYRSPFNKPNENIDLLQSLSLAADLSDKYDA
jgi:hypothetical protein